MIGKKGMCRKKLTGLLFVLTVFFFASQSFGAELLTGQEKEWLGRHKEIQVGAFNDYPPFGFVNPSGEAQGMSIDFWRLVAQKLGAKVKFHPTAFAAQLEGLKSGKLDSLAGIFPLDERKKSFDFTKEYTVVATRVYVRPQYAGLKGIGDLKGLKVGGVDGDSGKVIAEKANLTVKGFASYLDAIQAIAKGDIDAIVMDELVVNYYAVRNKLKDKIKTIGEPVDQGKMTLPVVKGNAILLSILNKGVSMVSPEEWLKIKQKWIGK